MKEKLAQYRALIEGETDIIAVMANTSAFIMENISGLNWAGFYRMKDDGLVLGPFQGRPACYRIEQGKGVCGHCAANRKSIIVPDVHAFPGHIACDSASKSELVAPVIHHGTLFGVIDLDAPEYNRFTDADKLFIEGIAEIFSQKL
ncbi:GAF domain-containing protein [Treponema vincentii]|uniref:GAF domain-containing protein n=1 Tax=Treponema vincentii TaxID=69710 RepID=UPI003D917B58